MKINFEAKLSKIGIRQIINVPLNVSSEFPSRGLVMVQGTINGVPFKTPLEPDGKGSHWLEVTSALSEAAGLSIGDLVSMELEPIKEWSEPEVPQDILLGLTELGVIEEWDALKAKSRWEWIRWIRSTLNPETRKKRIQVTASKLANGAKNPCCFDASRCTVPDVAKSGVLLDE